MLDIFFLQQLHKMYVLNAKQSKQATKKKKLLLKSLVGRCKIRGGGSLSSVLTEDQMEK